MIKVDKKLIYEQLNKISKHQIKISAVESCTGGLFAKLATDMPGCSNWFDCGVVTYSNFAKSKLATVDEELIEQFGAVSRQVSEAMCFGIYKKIESDIIVSITGIAGPEGGSVEKPIGTVWISWLFNQKIKSVRFNFQGGRNEVRYQSVYEACKGITEILELT